MGRPKKEIKIPLCPMCAKKMDREPYALNFEQITGSASYKIEFSSRVRVCATCAGSLMAHVHAWYKENNKTNFYSKFN